MSVETVVDDRQPILRVSDLHKHFGGLVAVDRFSMDVCSGEVLALVGDNGAGKSTLIKMVSGVHCPDGGSIHFDGREVVFAHRWTRAVTGSKPYTRTWLCAKTSMLRSTYSWDASRYAALGFYA